MRKKISLAALSTVALASGVTNLASAADLRAPVTKAPPSTVAVYNWTGFYIGGNAGYGWGDSSFNLVGTDVAARFLEGQVDPTSGSFDTSGFVGGAQLGYNWQFASNWVAGIEADFNGSDVAGDAAIAATVHGNPASLLASRKLEWFGTLRARLGVLPTERLLIYATGGLAYGRDKVSASFVNLGDGIFVVGPNNMSFGCEGNSTCWAGSASRTSAGWTVGGGLEFAGWDRWTFKFEYLHVNLGDQVLFQPQVPPNSGGTGRVFANFDDAAYDIVRFGLNYRFGAPVVGKY